LKISSVRSRRIWREPSCSLEYLGRCGGRGTSPLVSERERAGARTESQARATPAGRGAVTGRDARA
jgi:hypothetical protein